jgi:hypothetical protein
MVTENISHVSVDYTYVTNNVYFVTNVHSVETVSEKYTSNAGTPII